MLVSRLRESFPDLKTTESHPKALLKAGFESVLENLGRNWNNDHERDALISAICAKQGFENRWATDLAEDRWCEEEDPLSPCFRLGPVHYYWPNSLQCT